MGFLAGAGARLYFETHGSGPLMVMVPGANGTAAIFNRVTAHLAAHYTVCDRWFACLMACQWFAGIAAAYWISPRTWAGMTSRTHPHVWA